MKKSDVSRRRFLKASVLGTLAAPLAGAGCHMANRAPTVAAPGAPAAMPGGPAAAPGGAAAAALPAASAPPATVDMVNGMPYRMLGRTGVKVSILGVGGYHIGVQGSPDESTRIIRTAIDEGVNFLDNAWEYNKGMSEERMGLALQDGYRHKAFLMTKVCGRDEKTAMTMLEESLRRFKTDHLDLWQFHEINYDNDPDLVFAKDGAIHAAIKARQEGKVRFIGFTGHKSPHIHLKMLRQDFPWDTAQMPLNVMDAHYRSFAHQVVPELVKRGIGIIGMKSAGGNGGIIKDGGVSAAECLRYAMSLPTSVVLSGMDTLEIARQNIAAAKAWKPLSQEERAVLLAKVEPLAGDGRFERFKSTQDFDSQYHRQQHHLT
jgi:predicted aldo/keto reductase-like oxidoreductase